jgi:SAM-dependent methyltransferase
MPKAFDLFGQLAQSNKAGIVKAGRYAIQAEAERAIVSDIERKLDLAPDQSLLEIGCGAGDLLIPLSFRVAKAVGIDHPNMTKVAAARFSDPQVEFLAGEFPDVSFEQTFDRVLVYSVIHYLRDFDAAIEFVDRAVDETSKSGKLLVGDIPNSDRKRRFLNSEAGRAFDAEWKRRVEAQYPAEETSPADFSRVDCIGAFTDSQLLQLVGRYRDRGLNCYLLDQPSDLPFGHTREDILIERP